MLPHMSDTHQWTIQITSPPPPKCNAIILGDSEFYTGPFDPGTIQTIANIHAKNAGDGTDGYYIYVYEYPGTADENRIRDIGVAQQSPGQEIWIEIADQLIPDNPGGTWPLGVKVWCRNDESEPSWGSYNTRIWG